MPLPLPSDSASCSAPKSVWPSLLGDRDLAVEQRGRRRADRERPDERAELVGPVEAVARVDADLAAADRGERAVAVILDLVHPVVAVGRRIDQRRELRLDECRQRAAFRARALSLAPLRASSSACRLRSNDRISPPRPSVRMPDFLPRGDLVHRRGRLRRWWSPARRSACLLARRNSSRSLISSQLSLSLALRLAHAHQHPLALEPLAVEDELELALLQRRVGVADRLPGALVPEHHGAAAILALRDRAFEVAVVERMVLDVRTARRLSFGLTLGPFGTAQHSSTPSTPGGNRNGAASRRASGSGSAACRRPCGGLRRRSARRVRVKSRLARYSRSDPARPCAPPSRVQAAALPLAPCALRLSSLGLARGLLLGRFLALAAASSSCVDAAAALHAPLQRIHQVDDLGAGCGSSISLRRALLDLGVDQFARARPCRGP